MPDLYLIKSKMLKDIKELDIEYPKWKKKIDAAESIEDIESVYYDIILIEKKKFLIKMLSELGLLDAGLRVQISSCKEIENLNSMAKTYSVTYYKHNLIIKARKFDLIDTCGENRIQKMGTIEEINRKTKGLRSKIMFHISKESELAKSLYGSEYITTHKSVWAILTGMIY